MNIEYTMIPIRKIDDQWYTQGTSMVLFDHRVKLKEGAILFTQDWRKFDFTFWTFRSSVEEYDSGI